MTFYIISYTFFWSSFNNYIYLFLGTAHHHWNMIIICIFPKMIVHIIMVECIHNIQHFLLNLSPGHEMDFFSCSANMMWIYIYIYKCVCAYEGESIYVCAWVIVTWCCVFLSFVYNNKNESIREGKKRKKTTWNFSSSLFCSSRFFFLSAPSYIFSVNEYRWFVEGHFVCPSY